MRLLLMRHGDASWQAAKDSQRALSEKGRQQVQKQAQDTSIDWSIYEQLFASPYLRTQQTSQILQQTLNLNWPQTNSGLITPDGACEAVQELLLEQPQSNCVLVTHQPLVSCLIGYFCHADIYAGEPMMPASVAVLSGEICARGCMQLESLHHAE
ncbi:MAG: phosphohistidine phosphatase SixA [Gammaproteobacteria bacterium]|nr:phosphohistidine phosphatase SixA [Gammaproteobacteria bacterium]MCP4880756.1 phosphohistidine phosphatase SixA [Gammaproteobacteria bacterium]